jgi:glycosyltransferase involved in cell wall biosynthesis
MQKTTFPIEIIIHDDASTDRTASIVKKYADEYPHLIVSILQSENQWSKGIRPSPTYVWPSARGKYIALCEGDDYWTDPLKLQKQVNFLEENTEYGLVYTNHLKLFEDTKKIVKPNYDPHITDGNLYHKYLTSSFIGTLTVMARTDLIKEYLSRFEEIMINWVMGDRPLWLYISSKSKCGFLNDYTAVYRRNANSISSFQDIYKEIEFLKSSYDIRYYFIEHVRSVPKEIKALLDDTFNQELLSLYYKAKDKSNVKLMFGKIKKPRVQDYLRFVGSKNRFYNMLISLVFGVQKKFE